MLTDSCAAMNNNFITETAQQVARDSCFEKFWLRLELLLGRDHYIFLLSLLLFVWLYLFYWILSPRYFISRHFKFPPEISKLLQLPMHQINWFFIISFINSCLHNTNHRPTTSSTMTLFKNFRPNSKINSIKSMFRWVNFNHNS